MQPLVGGVVAVAFGLAFGCSAQRPVPMAFAGRAPALAPIESRPVAAAAAAMQTPEPGLESPEPALPAGIEPGVFTSVEVTGDAALAVNYARAGIGRAIVYLHGACGDMQAPRAWSSVSIEVGTLIALRGDRSCGKNDRYYWGPDTRQLESRVRVALARVAELRGATFEPDDVVLMGYSQGAARAQELHARHPELYPRVILAGIPVAPSAKHLAGARGVAVLGGQLELTTHMRTGVWALEANDIPVRFALFPKAAHGEFGPDAERVMSEAFEWLLAEP